VPKLEGVKERRHQPFYDTLVRAAANTAPTPLVPSMTRLFSSANIGNVALTNMKAAGQLSSDQTYVIHALRAFLYFRGAQAADMYAGCASQLYWTLEIGDKPFFQMGAWYFGAGGGIVGGDAQSLGTPDHRGILKLGQTISIPARQGFAVIGEFHPIGQAGAAFSDVRTNLINANANIGDRVIQFVLDGIHSREVL